jgi:rhamnosyltransferase
VENKNSKKISILRLFYQRIFMIKIAIVYILYNPNIEILVQSVNSIVNQIDAILFVDNDSDNLQDITNISVAQLISLSENTGIANATNIGIDYFQKLKYDYLVISDQDTVYSSDYIDIFKNKITSMSLKDIAAFVPSVYDTNSGSTNQFYIKRKIWLKKQSIKNDYAIVYQAIASGMIINLSCIEIIGLMKTELFIDYVDFEWCWRVFYKKWQIIAFPSMCIYHKIGDSAISIGKKVIPTHSHIREYYITRNTVYLALYSPFLCFLDKCILFIKSISFLFGYIFLSDNIKVSAKYCFTGFIHGIIKKLGKFRAIGF